MWVFDVETLRFLAVNDAAVRHYGYSREEFLAMTIKDVRPTEDVDQLMSLVTTSVGDFGNASDLSRHRKKDGSIVDVEVSWHKLNFAGRPAKLVLAHDVTERKRAEEALVQERILLRTVIDNLPDAIYVKDAAGRKVLANRADLENIGKTENEVLGKTDWDLYPTDVAAQFDADDQTVLRDGQAITNREELLVNARGRSRCLLTTKLPLRDDQGRITRLVGIGHDITDRKLAEKEILLQTARFQQLFQNAPMGILRVDENDIVLDANDGFKNIFQFSLDEMRGRHINEIVVPKAQREGGGALSSRVLGGEIVDLEAVRQRKDGSLIPVQIYGVPIIVNEKPVGVFAIYVDLSERKRAQERIGQLAQIVESSHDAIIATDLQANIVSWNQGAERIYGYRAEEILGKHISLLAPGERQEEISEKKRRLKSESGNRIAPYEAKRLRKDGQRIQVSVSLSRLKDAGGRIIGSSIIARDITERKRMEEERQATFDIIEGVNSTHNLDELLSLIHKTISKLLYAENCFVALHDQANDFIYFPFWVDKLDPCPEPRPVGIGFSSYVLRAGKPMLVDPELTAQMYQRGEIVKSGTSSASWLGVPLRTPSRTIGVLVVQHYEEEHAYDQRDLEFLETVGNQVAIAIERKRAETNLREAEDRLRQSQKMESIGNLAGGIAHDFNNLMTAVTGYSELALRSAKLDESLRFKIEEIKKAGERAASLTRQLLAFSRKQMLQPKVVDLNTVVTGMGRMLTRVISEDIDLHFRLDDSLGQIKADPGQIEQVLLNLAVNARDAMPEGGTLSIKTENVHLNGKLTQSQFVTEPGHYVMMSVSDTGCGMDGETKSHIFEPFFTTKEVGKGTGLGLATVYGIVKQSGGNIWVYSELGKGTIFKIYLPRVDEIVDEATNDSESKAAMRGEETILLVEDEEVVRNLACEILQTYGYSVLTAANGSEGLRIGRDFEGQIDLVISDVIMPLMGGREMAEKLRVMRPNIGVIFMSGFTDDAIVHHGVLDESMFFIQKPFSPDALAAMARQVLDLVIDNKFPVGPIPHTPSRVLEPESPHSVN
jgi:PAS domain S-box-containing protein